MKKIKGKYYLSDILTDDTHFKPHCINLITGGVGCGKSTFALDVLPKYAKSNFCILYLTDNNMNREQILKHKDNTTWYDKDWRHFINNHTKVQIVEQSKRIEGRTNWTTDENGNFELVKYPVAITTMNYAQVGAILYYGHHFDWSKFDFIICDELDNLINYRDFTPNDQVKILQYTIDKIRHSLNFTTAKIIGMTATPYKVYKEFAGRTFDILNELDKEKVADLRQYEIKYEWHYKDYGKVLLSIEQGKRGIVYFDRIRKLQRAEEILTKRGHKVASFWSNKNDKKPMTAEQKKLGNIS